jgi:hypothetical protein
MPATPSEPPPIACTLGAGDFKARLAWIADLNRRALRGARRDDLRLELTYAPEARDDVSLMVRQEEACCAFLAFDLSEEGGAVRVTITAPEEARAAADTVFAPFAPSATASAPTGCACCGASA